MFNSLYRKQNTKMLHRAEQRFIPIFVQSTDMITQEDLIEDAQRVQSIVEGAMTKSDYQEHGKYSTGPIYNKFDGIGELRDLAGIDDSNITKGRKFSREKLLNAIHELKDDLGRVPKRDEMIEQGNVSEEPFRRVFGTWGDAVIEAGYEPYRPNKHNVDKKLYTCEWCGTQEKRKVSQNKNQENWYCSEECNDEWLSENRVGEDHPQYDRVSTECDWCGNPKEVKPSVFEKRDHNFCGGGCAGNWWSENRVGENHPRWAGGPVGMECEVCGDIKQVKRANTEKFRTCSRSCHGDIRQEEMRGESNPNWVPDSTDYYGENWLEQRRKRIDRDGYQCIDCGQTREQHKEEYGVDLIVHHVIPRRRFNTGEELDWQSANRLTNLRTVCHECHGKWEGIPVAPTVN